jgi:hypothetical protein
LYNRQPVFKECDTKKLEKAIYSLERFTFKRDESYYWIAGNKRSY